MNYVVECRALLHAPCSLRPTYLCTSLEPHLHPLQDSKITPQPRPGRVPPPPQTTSDPIDILVLRADETTHPHPSPPASKRIEKVRVLPLTQFFRHPNKPRRENTPNHHVAWHMQATRSNDMSTFGEWVGRNGRPPEELCSTGPSSHFFDLRKRKAPSSKDGTRTCQKSLFVAGRWVVCRLLEIGGGRGLRCASKRLVLLDIHFFSVSSLSPGAVVNAKSNSRMHV